MFEYNPTPKENHENELWVREECYRFYAKMRQSNCNFMQILNLWMNAPFCSYCVMSDPIFHWDYPDIAPKSWREDIEFELGPEILSIIDSDLANEADSFFICKDCGSELRPWNDDIYIVSYHVEEHYGIPIEEMNKRNPPKKIIKQIKNLYERKCFGCGLSNGTLHIDHIIPQSAGGTAAFRNLQPLCEQCGNIKGDRMPEEITVTSLMYFEKYPSDSYENLFW